MKANLNEIWQLIDCLTLEEKKQYTKNGKRYKYKINGFIR